MIFSGTAGPKQALNYIITHDMICIDITFNSFDCTLTQLQAGWNPECSQSATISWMRPQAPQASASFNKEINRKYIDCPPTGCVSSHLRSERNIVKIPGRHAASQEMIRCNRNTTVWLTEPGSLHLSPCKTTSLSVKPNISEVVSWHLPFYLSPFSFGITLHLPIFRGSPGQK